ncbi:MAG: KH domain-containing protein [Clostridia bacterium]|nr:KH domain-containing protein [Clostridia bacterium]
MEKSYVFEGKTTNEAIEKGLKELKVSKNKVDIKVLEAEDKRSFFSILTPRVVKVELTLKEDSKEEKQIEDKKETMPKKKKENPNVDVKEIIQDITVFMNDFVSKFEKNKLIYEIKEESDHLYIDINGEDTGFLIGYRGEVLNSLQTIITNIANKKSNGKVKIALNISGYREKREKDLQNLADRIATSVIKTGKSVTLEPMIAYERKIIHLRLQENSKVSTHSVGEEPYRKLVVSLK